MKFLDPILGAVLTVNNFENGGYGIVHRNSALKTTYTPLGGIVIMCTLAQLLTVVLIHLHEIFQITISRGLRGGAQIEFGHILD